MPEIIPTTWPELWSLLAHNYGLDWLAMALTFVSMWRLGEHKRDGFLWGFAATIVWTAFNATVPSVAGVLANIVFTALNIRGYLRWRGANPAPPPPVPLP